LWRAVRRLMIFDRRIRVQERQLRRLQRKIVVQSLAGGGVFATLCVALFIWLPVWRETVEGVAAEPLGGVPGSGKGA
jgi:hypothetical protein